MTLIENVYFSLLKGDVPSPVTVYKEREWTFENGVSLHASIIGKSHRIVCRTNGICFTEFVAYPIPSLQENALIHFPLKIGESQDRQYQENDLVYRVTVGIVPRLFEDMEDFLGSLKGCGELEVLHHPFGDTGRPQFAKAFTGIAADLSANRYYTVHTYPENCFSALSKSHIGCVAEVAPELMS